MDKFLIVLNGQGDTIIKLCAPETGPWLDEPCDNEGEEDIPEAVILGADPADDDVEMTVFASTGSGDNDRALAAPGIYFDSFTELVDYIVEHSVKITGEFVGNIY